MCEICICHEHHSLARLTADQLGFVEGRVARKVVDHTELLPARLLVVPSRRRREDLGMPLSIGQVDLFVLAPRVGRSKQVQETLLEVSVMSRATIDRKASRRGRLDGEAIGWA